MKRKQENVDGSSLNELIHLANNFLRVFYIVFIIGIILFCLITFKQLKLFSILFGVLKVISPLFVGFIISWLFYPLFNKLKSKGINSVFSALIIFAIIISVIFLIIYIFIPVIYNQVNDLISYIPNILNNISNFISKFFDKLDIKGIDISTMKQNFISVGQKYIVEFTTSLPNNIINILKSMFSAVGVILISLVVSLYLLIDFESISEGFYSKLKKHQKKEYIPLLKKIGTNARKVVNSTLLVAFMVFVFDTIGFSIVGLNASVVLGLLCGITDLIPYFGPYIGGAAAVIVGFAQSPVVGICVLIIAIIVQLLESYLLQPVIMSKAMHLHPVIIIVGLLLFGYLFGIIGMIIATPCLSIFKEVYLFYVDKRKKSDSHGKEEA